MKNGLKLLDFHGLGLRKNFGRVWLLLEVMKMGKMKGLYIGWEKS